MARTTLDSYDRFRRALASGGVAPNARIRLVYYVDVLADHGLTSVSCQTSTISDQVRISPTWMPDMVICDGKVAIVADTEDPGAEPLWIDQSAVVSMLTLIFDHAWEAAVPWAANGTGTPSAPNREPLELEHIMLKLLANGATDESVARHLGISLRTTRRYVATLMNQLAATSRFQAGAEAVKRGWLS